MFSNINLKLVRSFSMGFAIHSLALNGFYVELHLGCVHLAICNKAKGPLFGFNNYWNS